ncbi:hypothetical protein GCM10008959_17430 [Deinococcus seoulensis]|uniref:Uncharacterized protein n=1 Tax=Deinococcus seoulensis TaxID=1837379 RepID=A0ABQ2RQQ1_9DEIO|nr:hypothetical protein GCM10008959_17430 [Deinococcus seoulensis]
MRIRSAGRAARRAGTGSGMSSDTTRVRRAQPNGAPRTPAVRESPPDATERILMQFTAYHVRMTRIPSVSLIPRNPTGLSAPRPEPALIPLASVRIEWVLQSIQSESV